MPLTRINNPLPGTLAEECKKASKTLKSFNKPEKFGNKEYYIPQEVVKNAKGLAVSYLHFFYY